jgi:phospholipase/lecithinase/hemolysin
MSIALLPIHRPWRLAALALAAALTACGGGDDTPAPAAKPATTRLVVIGDSLADAGTFGLKFTIQVNDIYPERVATAFGLGKGCNAFVFTGTTFTANSTAGCSNYAVGGGIINPASSSLTATDPRGLAVQFTAATTTANFSSGDTLLVDGGGNDAASLVSAYLQAATDGGTAYLTLLRSLLSTEQVTAAAAAGATGLAGAGTTYMTALADRYAALITSGALDKGAQRIVVLNMPGITNTPRFQTVLAAIGAVQGATAKAQSEALFKGWIEAYNTRLASKLSGNAKVALVDFYTEFNAQIAQPATYGLSNVTTPACPATGVGTDGLPSYTFATCTDAALAASPPAGASGSDWYKRYAFSDGFHPTPYGHELMTEMIRKALVKAGWL